MKCLASALLLLVVAISVPVCAQSSGVTLAAAETPVITVEFSNPQLTPAHWTLTLHPNGSGHFRTERGVAPATGRLEAADVDRDLALSSAFANRVFALAERKQGFRINCESHLKVAYQGTKTFSYSGPAGKGSCTFNYSADKEIAALGEEVLAVATTQLEGARLLSLLAHDRLGLDRETEFLLAAARDGRAQQLCGIREILERLATDDSVLERVRKRVRQMLLLE